MIFNARILKLLLAIGAMGVIVSHPALLGWLGSSPPWYAFALWYVIFFLFVSFIGVSVFPGKFRLRHAVGIVVLWFALSPVLGWVNNPVFSEQLTGATVTGVEAGPEETILTWAWMTFTTDSGILIFLVYILAPILLTTLAVFILRPGPFMREFKRMF